MPDFDPDDFDNLRGIRSIIFWTAVTACAWVLAIGSIAWSLT